MNRDEIADNYESALNTRNPPRIGVTWNAEYSDDMVFVDAISGGEPAEIAFHNYSSIIDTPQNGGTFPPINIDYIMSPYGGAKAEATKNAESRHTTDDIQIIAAMPAFNEERHIGEMIRQAQEYVSRVVVVDDGSSDRTADIAESFGAMVIRHPQNRGYGGALATIFETARKLNPDVLVIIDSDGQHDPKEIPQLIAPLMEDKGVDVVIGSRFLNSAKDNIPFYRKVGMKVLDTVTNLTGNIRVTDTQSGFRAYGRKAIQKIHIRANGMAAGSEILLEIGQHKLKTAEIPISVRYDLEGTSSQNPVTHGMGILFALTICFMKLQPVKRMVLPGTIMFALPLIFENRIIHFGSEFGYTLTEITGLNTGFSLTGMAFSLLNTGLMITGVALVVFGIIIYSKPSFHGYKEHNALALFIEGMLQK